MKKPEREFIVSAEVTISIHCTVKASTEREALKKAEECPMQTFCHQCARGGKEEQEEWRTSGELDGEPVNMRIDE